MSGESTSWLSQHWKLIALTLMLSHTAAWKAGKYQADRGYEEDRKAAELAAVARERDLQRKLTEVQDQVAEQIDAVRRRTKVVEKQVDDYAKTAAAAACGFGVDGLRIWNEASQGRLAE